MWINGFLLTVNISNSIAICMYFLCWPFKTDLATESGPPLIPALELGGSHQSRWSSDWHKTRLQFELWWDERYNTWWDPNFYLSWSFDSFLMKKYYENEFETNYEEMSYISANYFTFINLRLGCSAMFCYFDKFDKILILCTQINVVFM